MVLVVKAFSIFVIIYGCVLVLKPRTLKKIIDWVKKEDKFMMISGIKTAIAALFVLAAPSARIPWIIFLFGGLGLLGGIVVFILKDKIKERYMVWAENLPNKKIVAIGIAAVVLGAILSIAA